MTLGPLLQSPLSIQIHAFAAMLALVVGIFQFLLTKGTKYHKTMGWIWVCLITTVSASSFFIHEIQLWGVWSPIHILSIVTLVSLAYAIWAIKNARVREHKAAMLSTYCFGLIVAGGFTFLPGRIMNAVLIGG
ncbi:DUF2306 domain-containing protein [Ostreibacterium oceani]|uniref:DUF2306 domain-containing protein n=1 Tax=Ostreibacterium oceani TaxID=2654998 RepID=A0A6N7F003_9GAMM|nr:DUF2306 domain-containing protein [Ostreibacterium oceani]MPV86949.1 DUF2306 domain-containing protein [Ostreibacterium oceani]